MMITADISNLEASLAAAIQTIERRLKNMVQGFAYEFAVTAISKTPLGDDTEQGFQRLYLKRLTDPDWESYGLLPEKGFSRGAWQASLNGSLDAQSFYGETSGNQAADKAKLDMNSYRLGQTVTIGNYGPYIQRLESGSSKQAPEGISKPTLEQVQTSYRIDLQRYYSMN